MAGILWYLDLMNTKAHLGFIVEFIFFGVYFTISMFSIIYSCIRLRKPGMSKKMRMSFFKYHMLYVGIGLVSSSLYVGHDFYEWMTMTPE